MSQMPELTGELVPFVADLVPASIWMPNENGRFDRSATFPHRRNFLQRVRPYDSHALLDWIDPVGSILAPGSPVDLKLSIRNLITDVIPCEVESSRQERGQSAGFMTYRFVGDGFRQLAHFYAQAAGRPAQAGFRDGRRFPLDQAVRIEGRPGRGRLLDVSRRGVQVSQRGSDWAVGDSVTLDVKRGWFRTERLGVRVVWATADGRESRFGARIVDVAPRTQQWLARTLGEWSQVADPRPASR
jgi:hypothetical protein